MGEHDAPEVLAFAAEARRRRQPRPRFRPGWVAPVVQLHTPTVADPPGPDQPGQLTLPLLFAVPPGRAGGPA